jgi:hypothetical protein
MLVLVLCFAGQSFALGAEQGMALPNVPDMLGFMAGRGDCVSPLRPHENRAPMGKPTTTVRFEFQIIQLIPQPICSNDQIKPSLTSWRPFQ